jgi:hypothetical protein
VLPARGCSAASRRLSFQPIKVEVKLVFRDTFPPLQFFDAGADFGVDFLAVCRQPLVALVQNFQRTVNHVVVAAVAPERNASAMRCSCSGFS